MSLWSCSCVKLLIGSRWEWNSGIMVRLKPSLLSGRKKNQCHKSNSDFYYLPIMNPRVTSSGNQNWLPASTNLPSLSTKWIIQRAFYYYLLFSGDKNCQALVPVQSSPVQVEGLVSILVLLCVYRNSQSIQ